MKYCFLIGKSMYILKVYSVHLYTEMNINVEKISFGENKLYKK